MPEIGVEMDASAFCSFCDRAVAAVEMGTGNVDLRRGMENAQAMYLADMRQKFQSASHGDGRWPDLAPSTKLKRYYEAGGRFKRTKGIRHADRLKQVSSIPFPILYITGKFYTSLYPGEPENIFTDSPDSVSAGTYVEWAHYHQEGGGRLPQRRFLIEPTDELLHRMAAPIMAGVRSMIAKAIG